MAIHVSGSTHNIFEMLNIIRAISNKDETYIKILGINESIRIEGEEVRGEMVFSFTAEDIDGYYRYEINRLCPRRIKAEFDGGNLFRFSD